MAKSSYIKRKRNTILFPDYVIEISTKIPEPLIYSEIKLLTIELIKCIKKIIVVNANIKNKKKNECIRIIILCILLYIYNNLVDKLNKISSNKQSCYSP